jgi:hypothetical protein
MKGFNRTGPCTQQLSVGVRSKVSTSATNLSQKLNFHSIKSWLNTLTKFNESMYLVGLEQFLKAK